MKINIIVAMSENNGIGLNGKMPWNIKEDLLHFSKTTQKDGNNAIVMGRKTWESLPYRPESKKIIDKEEDKINKLKEKYPPNDDMAINVLYTSLLKIFQNMYFRLLLEDDENTKEEYKENLEKQFYSLVDEMNKSRKKCNLINDRINDLINNLRLHSNIP